MLGMHGGLRAAGPKADLALIVADADAVAAGVFTTNVMCAAPVTYCKQVLAKHKPARAVSPPNQQQRSKCKTWQLHSLACARQRFVLNLQTVQTCTQKV